mgnify:CR=1 FL=1
MIDIKILRTNPEIVRAALTNKVVKWVELDVVMDLDNKRVVLKQELDKLSSTLHHTISYYLQVNIYQ